MGGERGELVGCGDKWEAGDLGDPCRGGLAELRMGVQTRPDCRSADGEGLESRQTFAETGKAT